VTGRLVRHDFIRGLFCSRFAGRVDMQRPRRGYRRPIALLDHVGQLMGSFRPSVECGAYWPRANTMSRPTV
jgi:hypothetical protein